MVMAHGLEGASDHGVLKVRRAVHGCNFARKFLPDAKVPGAPCDALSQADQSGGNSVNRRGRFPGMDVAGQMRLHTAREVEAPFLRSANQSKFFERHHRRPLSRSASIRI